jgi:hypothetical protein
MLTPNPALYPTRGWQYHLPDGCVLKASSRDRLIRALTDYRALNHLGAGEPDVDVDAQVCAAEPRLCRPRKRGIRASGPFTNKDVARACSAIVRAIGLGKAPKVADSIVKWRTAVCIECPHNRHPSITCAPCESRIAEATRLVRGHAPPIQGLASCAIFGHPNDLAVRLDVPSRTSAPANCWRH